MKAQLSSSKLKPGMTFERLTLIEPAGFRLLGIKVPKSYALWKCLCRCGKEAVVKAHDLKRGHARSCGCLQRDAVSKHGGASDKRGYHRLYRLWCSMRTRCNNPRSSGYPSYGGRGIYIDAPWNDFATFLKDMEPTFKEGLSVERRDNNGPYAKWNCYWATAYEQHANKRSNRRIEWQGESLTVAQWARKLGLKPTCLAKRLDNWPLERAMKAQMERNRRR